MPNTPHEAHNETGQWRLSACDRRFIDQTPSITFKNRGRLKIGVRLREPFRIHSQPKRGSHIIMKRDSQYYIYPNIIYIYIGSISASAVAISMHAT